MLSELKPEADTTLQISLNPHSPVQRAIDFEETKEAKRKENSSDNSANIVAQSTLSKTPPANGKLETSAKLGQFELHGQATAAVEKEAPL